MNGSYNYQMTMNDVPSFVSTCSIGCRTLAFLFATILLSTTGYADEEDQFEKQARIDVAERLYLYHADDSRKRLSESPLSSQEIEETISAAITQRAECSVDAMLDLVAKRPEFELKKLLSWLAGKRYNYKSPIALDSATRMLVEQEMEECDANYYRAIAR